MSIGDWVAHALVYERWGGRPQSWQTVEAFLARVEQRHGFTFAKEDKGDLLQFAATDRYGAGLGWLLLAGNIAAVSAQCCQAHVTPWPLQDAGPLHDALSAEGVLVLPPASWLLADIAPADRVRLLNSRAGGGFEASIVQKERPQTRAELLFEWYD